MTTKKRQATRPTNVRYIPNLILYQVGNFYKEKRIEILTGLIMAIVWLMGFMLGAMMMAGMLGGV